VEGKGRKTDAVGVVVLPVVITVLGEIALDLCRRRPPPAGTSIPTLLMEPAPIPRRTASDSNYVRKPVWHVDCPGWRLPCRVSCHLRLLDQLARLLLELLLPLLPDWLETSLILVVEVSFVCDDLLQVSCYVLCWLFAAFFLCICCFSCSPEVVYGAINVVVYCPYTRDVVMLCVSSLALTRRMTLTVVLTCYVSKEPEQHFLE
jgi:hypothetical protein